jgi:hypothetical protein
MIECFACKFDDNLSCFFIKMPVIQADVTIDLGEPFVLYITYKPKSGSFGLNFNGEVLDDYTIVNKVPGLNIVNATVSGAVTVNYVGFTKTGILLRSAFLLGLDPVLPPPPTHPLSWTI